LASLWRNRDYLLLWGGQALSDTGSAVSELAFPLLVLLVTRSAAQAGLVAALNALPRLLLTLPAGALVDRWDRRRIMLACDTTRALALSSIPLGLAMGWLNVWQLYAVALIEGALAVIFDLANDTAVAQVVTPAQLTNAVAQDELVESGVTLVGPSLAGALYSLGAALPFLADAISYVISVVSLSLIRTPFQRQRTAPSANLMAEIGSGLRWVWRQPFILSMTLMMGAGALAIPGTTLIIIVLAQRAGASTWAIGLIFAAGGVGGLIGAWITPRLRRLTVGQSILSSRWFYALSWPFYALTPWPLALGLITFGQWIFEPIEDVPYFSHRLKLIPDELRGRVISVCRLAPGLTRPLGLALTGLLIQRIGVFPTIWLGWGWMLLTTTLLTVVPYVRRER
jgi:MFS family permease